MTLVFNCDELKLWNNLDLDHIMILALELYPAEVIKHCADEYCFSEDEVYEHWGIGSMLIYERGAQPSIKVDYGNVIFTI